MENIVHLKCTCGHCGGIIEYLSKAVGQIVECPHCREKSRLPEPELPNPTIPDEPLEKPVRIARSAARFWTPRPSPARLARRAVENGN